MKAVCLTLLFIGVVAAQSRFRLCAPRTTISENTCIALQNGESPLTCVRVEDSAECAIRLNRGEADFGIFTAEEALLADNFYPKDTQVIAELRHSSRVLETSKFQSVAVVRTNYTAGSFEGLRQGGLCHPGFSQTQFWTDSILKSFERHVFQNETCNPELTAAENEAINLRDRFGRACRPGNWVAESAHDLELKQKYPELCAICDNTTACRYARTDNHGHTGALDCLFADRGVVAYVALSYVYEYFSLNASSLATGLDVSTLDERLSIYQFLCPNGSVQPLNTPNPCSWISQPWDAIAVRTESAAALQENLKTWLPIDPAAETQVQWQVALNSILLRDSVIQYLPTFQSLATYLAGRKNQLSIQPRNCGSTIRWCTIGTEETNKCNWVAHAGFTHGIEPNITCNQANSTFDCFRNIAANSSDIITIDSNYGYLARRVYGLSTVAYTETLTDRNSVIIAVVREGATYNVSSFASLKSRTACFPEYGGIAWLSFLNAARLNNVISDSCDYKTEVSNLLSGACTPGIADRDHRNNTADFDATSLCSLCPIESNNASCSANSSNIFFGDRGALECLTSAVGDIAFIEVKNLLDYVTSGVIDPSKYRVLCRNGTLASYTGFNVDTQCALSVTIDSEVMGRSNRSDIDSKNAVSALLSLKNWLGYRLDSLRPIHVYGPFNGTKDLLFKDSTTGLETTSSTLRAVLAYKELFAFVESCVASGATTVFASLSTVLLLLLVHFYQ